MSKQIPLKSRKTLSRYRKVKKIGIDQIIAMLVLVSFGYLLLGANVSADTRPSNVTVSAYVSISLSTNMSSIEFGNVNPNTNDNPADHNSDGAGGGTSYWVTIGADSNVNADLCIRDNWALNTSGGDVIGNGNYTWDNDTVSTNPALPGTAMSTTLTSAGNNIAPGSQHYYRFWLDIPSGQAAGTYNNSVIIEGRTTGTAC